MNPIIVLHTIHWPVSGIVSLLKEVLKRIDQKHYECHVIFFEYDKETIEDFSRICSSVHCLHFSRSRIKALLKYRKLIHQISPDILHSHSFQPGVWGRLFKRRNIAHTCTFHNQYPYFFSNNFRSLFKRKIELYSICYSKTKVICVSNSVQATLQKLMPDYPAIVIANGIRVDYLSNYSEQHKSRVSNSDNNNFLIISVGRLDDQKGFDILLRSIAIIKNKYRNVKLQIVGEGKERKMLENLAMELNIEQLVAFEGYQNDPFKFLARASIYVCSSRYEGFGLSIAEAMALGLAVVSTRIDGVSSLIKDYDTGLFANPEDPEDLAKKITFIIENSELRQKISRNGQLFINENFDIKDTTNRYCEIYKKIA